jgi:membrane protein required for colicin V production
MNLLDMFILIPIAWGLYKGFTRGLIIELASIVAILLAVWGAVVFSDKMAHYLKGTIDWQPAHLSLLAFTVTFLAIVVLVMLLAKLLTGLADVAALGSLNKITGALFGAFKSLLLVSVLLFILAAAGKKITVISSTAKKESKLYKPVSSLATTLIPALKNSKLGISE